MAPYHRRHCLFSVLSVFIIFTNRMNATTRFHLRFHWCFFGLTYSRFFFSYQWLFITVTVFDCCCFSFSSLSLTWLFLPVDWSSIPSELFFGNRLQFYVYGTMLLYRSHHGLLLFLLFSIVVTSRMSAINHFYRWFHREWFTVSCSPLFFKT